MPALQQWASASSYRGMHGLFDVSVPARKQPSCCKDGANKHFNMSACVHVNVAHVLFFVRPCALCLRLKNPLSFVYTFSWQ